MNEPTIQVNQKWTKIDREGKLRLLMEGRTNSRYKLKQNMLLWYVVLRKKKLKVKSAELHRVHIQSTINYSHLFRCRVQVSSLLCWRKPEINSDGQSLTIDTQYFEAEHLTRV